MTLPTLLERLQHYTDSGEGAGWTLDITLIDGTRYQKAAVWCICSDGLDVELTLASGDRSNKRTFIPLHSIVDMTAEW